MSLNFHCFAKHDESHLLLLKERKELRSLLIAENERAKHFRGGIGGKTFQSTKALNNHLKKSGVHDCSREDEEKMEGKKDEMKEKEQIMKEKGENRVSSWLERKEKERSKGKKRNRMKKKVKKEEKIGKRIKRIWG